MQRRIGFWLAAIVAFLCFCLPASADVMLPQYSVSVDGTVDVTEVAPGMIRLNLDRNRWCYNDGTLIPRHPPEVDGELDYTISAHTLSEAYAFAYVDLAQPLDCRSVETIRLICRVNTENPEHQFAVRTVICSGNERLYGDTVVPSSGWCAIDLDIGSWSHRDAITRVEVYFGRPNGSAAELEFLYLQMDEPMDDGLRTRFMTDAFSALGGNAFITPGADVAYLAVTENSPMLTATVLVPDDMAGANAIRLSLDNQTACQSLTVQYAYRPDGGNARSVTLDIGQGRQNYLFEVPNAAEVRYIRMIFTGAREGLITFHSLGVVSVYESGITPLGTITECAPNEDGNAVIIRGTVAHDILIANREKRLALFAVDAWDSVDTVLIDGRAPDATADISIRYTFTLPLAENDYAALGASYLVALQTQDETGKYTYVPIAEPRSLSVPEAAQNFDAQIGTAKGVQTELVSLAEQTGASLYLIDLALDRLCDGSTSGARVAEGETNLYFNRDVLAALDRAVQTRSAAGEAVYLRFLISEEDSNVCYAISPDDCDSDVVRGIWLNTEAARNTVGAITTFLTERYNGSSMGEIAGIIVGRRVDDAALYNFTGSESLSDYVDHYADLLTLIANCARSKNPAMKVIVPISDRRPADYITADMLVNRYDSELFLHALSKRLEDFSAPAVSLMLESEHNPFSLTDGVLNPDTEEGEAILPLQNADTTAYYNADNLGDFSAALDRLSAIYTSIPDTFIYFWTPAEDTGDALSAAYAYLYYRLRFSTHAEAFVVSFAQAEAAGDSSGMPALRHLMRYIDTARSMEVSEPALAVFGTDSWYALIDNFDPEALAVRTWYEGALSEPTGTAQGRYPYWDFSGMHSTRGWYAGTHISEVSVRGTGTLRALEGKFALADAPAGAYGELVYRFAADGAAGEPLYVFDRIAFTVGIEGDGVWEICIRAGGGNACLEQKQVIAAGDTVTLCLTPAELGAVLTRDLKLCAKPVSGSGEGKLCLYRVVGESDTLGDDALRESLDELRQRDAAIAGEGTSILSLAWTFGICAVVIFSFAIAVLLGRKREEA